MFYAGYMEISILGVGLTYTNLGTSEHGVLSWVCFGRNKSGLYWWIWVRCLTWLRQRRASYGHCRRLSWGGIVMHLMVQLASDILRFRRCKGWKQCRVRWRRIIWWVNLPFWEDAKLPLKRITLVPLMLHAIANKNTRKGLWIKLMWSILTKVRKALWAQYS